MRTTKITIGRLFNLGSYEHVRYEISVEIAEGESARDALVGLEKIVNALAPERSCAIHTQGELERELHRLKELEKEIAEHPEDEFRRRHGYFVGTPREYVDRCTESHIKNVEHRLAYEKRAARARELLDDLGGSAKWTDSKLDWEQDEEL